MLELSVCSSCCWTRQLQPHAAPFYTTLASPQPGENPQPQSRHSSPVPPAHRSPGSPCPSCSPMCGQPWPSLPTCFRGAQQQASEPESSPLCCPNNRKALPPSGERDARDRGSLPTPIAESSRPATGSSCSGSWCWGTGCGGGDRHGKWAMTAGLTRPISCSWVKFAMHEGPAHCGVAAIQPETGNNTQCKGTRLTNVDINKNKFPV